jgi:hypothetical protein
MVKKTNRQQRLSQSLFVGIVIIFIPAWIGEALIDLGYIQSLQPHALGRPAIWICLNLLILIILNGGEIGYREKTLTRDKNPLLFWLIMGFALISLNGILWYGQSTYG